MCHGCMLVRSVSERAEEEDERVVRPGRLDGLPLLGQGVRWFGFFFSSSFCCLYLLLELSSNPNLIQILVKQDSE